MNDTDEHGYENCEAIAILAISGTLKRATILGTYRKTQRKSDSALEHLFRLAEVGIDKDFDTVGAKVE